MDSFQRLARLVVFFIVGLMLGGATSFAFASSSYAPTNAWSYPWSTNTGNFASVAAVCAYDVALPSWATASPGYTFTCVNVNQPANPVPGESQGTYQVKAQKGANVFYTARVTYYYSRCPDGGTLQNGMCVIPDNCPAAGTPQSSGWFLMGSSPTSPFNAVTCAGSCLVSFDGTAPAGTATVSGVKQYYARGTWQYLGPSNTCTGGSTTPPAQTSLPADTCAPGMQGGYVNGKWTCVNPSTGETQPQSTPAPQTPKTENKETTTTTNPDGSTTTTTTTDHGDGSQTVTVTITQPNGDKEETTTHTPADKDEHETFCEENPDSPICKDSNFGGDCGSFTCDGDAIQCAIAQHQHQKRCDDENAYMQNSYIAQAKTILEGGSDSVTDPIATPETRALGSFDTSDMLTPGCPAPRSYTVLGGSFTINYQPFCDIAAIVKIFLVVGALLLGGRIVVGGI